MILFIAALAIIYYNVEKDKNEEISNVVNTSAPLEQDSIN